MHHAFAAFLFVRFPLINGNLSPLPGFNIASYSHREVAEDGVNES